MDIDDKFNFFNVGVSKELDIAGDEARILIGYLCNSNCKFCVQGHRERTNRSFEEIKKDMIKARENGATDSAFCGGEFSIRKDIFDIFKTIKELGFKTMMLCTNGRMFAYKKFTDEFVDHLLEPNERNGSPNSLVFSIHGHTPEIHDFLTGVNGAFEQVCKGLQNLKDSLKEKGKTDYLRLYVNFVITKQNYKYMSETLEFLNNFNMFSTVQFIFIMPYENAEDNFDLLVPKITDIIPYVKKTIQKSKDIGLTVKFQEFPYCLLSGYEEYSSYLNEKISDFDKYLEENGMIKLDVCENCRFEKICPGFDKIHAKNLNKDDLKPIEGKKLNSREEFIEELQEQGREILF